MIMRAIGKAWGRVTASRAYRKLFVAEIDPKRVEEMKDEMMRKYHRMGFF